MPRIYNVFVYLEVSACRHACTLSVQDPAPLHATFVYLLTYSFELTSAFDDGSLVP